MVLFRKQLREVEILECRGDLDVPSMVAFQNKLRRLMEQDRKKVVLNLAHARHVDLTAIGILVERITEIRQSAGDIRLCNMNSDIRRTFRMVGVAKLIETFSNQDKAVRSFQIA